MSTKCILLKSKMKMLFERCQVSYISIMEARDNMPPHYASRWTHRALNRLADIFSLQTIKLYNEPLHSIHKKFYVKTRVFKKLSRMFGAKHEAVSDRTATKLLYAAATIISYPASLLLPSDKVGQSVLAVYKKTGK